MEILFIVHLYTNWHICSCGPFIYEIIADLQLYVMFSNTHWLENLSSSNCSLKYCWEITKHYIYLSDSWAILRDTYTHVRNPMNSTAVPVPELGLVNAH